MAAEPQQAAEDMLMAAEPQKRQQTGNLWSRTAISDPEIAETIKTRVVIRQRRALYKLGGRKLLCRVNGFKAGQIYGSGGGKGPGEG